MEDGIQKSKPSAEGGSNSDLSTSSDDDKANSPSNSNDQYKLDSSPVDFSSQSSTVSEEKTGKKKKVTTKSLHKEKSILDEDVQVAGADEQENLNVRAAIVHMLGDMIQSTGVIVAALIIYFKPEWTIADPICTFLFSILVMITTVPIFQDCMRFLMEAAPESIDSEEVYKAILEVDNVKEIDDFHLWSLSDEKPIFTAHVVTNGKKSETLSKITQLLEEEFKIFHSTVQVVSA